MITKGAKQKISDENYNLESMPCIFGLNPKFNENGM